VTVFTVDATQTLGTIETTETHRGHRDCPEWSEQRSVLRGGLGALRTASCVATPPPQAPDPPAPILATQAHSPTICACAIGLRYAVIDRVGREVEKR
jgi:hypothetical protein